MAAAMARKYGSDVSCPTAPGPRRRPTRIRRRAPCWQKEHRSRRQSSAAIHDLNPKSFDLIVNMCGSKLSGMDGMAVENWDVVDPMGRSEETFRKTRDDLEMRVMTLILRIRSGKFDSRLASSRQ